MVLDLDKEKAWVTFLDDNWEKRWYPISDSSTGCQLDYDDTIMDLCRRRYEGSYFGIAPTSQMVMGNSVRDNV